MDRIRDAQRSAAVAQQFWQCRVGENGGIFRMYMLCKDETAKILIPGNNAWIYAVWDRDKIMGNTVLQETNNDDP